MAWRRDEPEPVPAEQAFGALTIANLRPLAALPERRRAEAQARAGRPPRPGHDGPRSGPGQYERLEDLAQKAVQEAAHDQRGLLQRDRFVARHGRLPAFHYPSEKKQSDRYDYDRHPRPTPLALFFPNYDWLPTDLRQLLLAFVPSPPPFALPTVAEPPASFRETWTSWQGNRAVEQCADVPVRVRDGP